MSTSPKRELCENCCKQIYIHQKVLICSSCNKISHFKCGKSVFTYNQTIDQWLCSNCCTQSLNRYCPFESICYNKYIVEDPEAHEEIEKIKNCLKNCKIISNEEINSKFFGYSKKPLSVFANNIDGMSQNFDTLLAQLSSLKNNFDFLALTETNIYESHKNLYRIPGYSSYFNSKYLDKHKGSGVGIYITENFTANPIKELSITTTDIESFFISVCNSGKPLNFGVIYRPPNGNIKNFYLQFEKILEELSCSEGNGNSIVCGDFNVNLLKNDSNKSKFENIFFSNCFTPTISLATHEKPGCDPSCIDNVFVSNVESVVGSGILSETKVSHHYPTVCFYDLLIETDSGEVGSSLPHYDYCESNIIEFNDKLVYKLAVENYSADENGFNKFTKCIQDTIDECFKVDPKMFNKSKRNRLSNPWITNGLIKSINYKNFLYEKWKKSKNKKNKFGDSEIYDKYKNYRKKLRILIKSAKNNFYSKKFDKCKGNSKKTWELINELRGKSKTKSKSSFLINGSIVKDRRIIADEFNKYFTSIAHNLNENASSEWNNSNLPIIPIPHFSTFIGKRVNESMFFEPCSIEEIKTIIDDFDNGKASDISIRVLKNCVQILAPQLAMFYNKFIELGIFPDILKIGQVTPIFKKGNTQSLQNYRPISTLPCFGKILEKVIYSRLYKFFVSKNILYENQYGFRSHHSTSHAVNYSIDKITCNIENKNHVLGIFIDLSKAFDTISHEKLLFKLENYGIRGPPLALLQSYMTKRQQLTNFNGTKSDILSLLYGVPQGSVLGPLLFILYINDIIKCSKLGHFVMFADDTNIFVVANTENEVYSKANKLLKEINLYMLSNQLHINTEKCVYMHFRPNYNHDEQKHCARAKVVGSDNQLFIHKNKIKKTNMARFLGIIIDEDLNWNGHLEHLEQKLKSSIITIKRIKKFIPHEHYSKLYHTLFVSHLTYGISAWGSVLSYKLKKIFNIQKRCIRLLYGKKLNFDHADYYRTCARARSIDDHLAPKDYVLEHTKPLFTEHEFLTVHNLHKIFMLNEIYKIRKYRYPIPLFTFLDKTPESSRNFRNNNILVPNYHLNISRHQFLYCGTKTWNKVNSKLALLGMNFLSDLSTSVSVAKKRFKQILLCLQSSGNHESWENYNFNFE